MVEHIDCKNNEPRKNIDIDFIKEIVNVAKKDIEKGDVEERNVIKMSRDDFYLNTGRIKTNLKQLSYSTMGIQRLFYFGGTPEKEEIIHFVNKIKDQQKQVDLMLDKLREFGKVV